MSQVRYLIGDTRKILATLPDNSVDLVLTSSPFLALRSYLPPDHPDKGLEMGSEATPGELIDALIEVVEECRRVLAPHGSICFELGDTYSGSGGAGGDYNDDGLRDGQPRFDGSASRAYGTGAAARPARIGRANGWPEAKSLCLIPELFRVTLVYGRNPLTGRTTPPWRARNVVRWCRPNPPVGALGDKVRPATSDMLIACVGRKRYFDLDAVRTAPQVVMGRAVDGNNVKGSDNQSFRFSQRVDSNPAGAPPLDHWWHDDTFGQDAWNIPTHGYPGSHYATFPEALCVKPILAMCPTRVCTTCGKPSERITEPSAEYASRPNAGRDFLGSGHDRGQGKSAPAPFRAGNDPSRIGAQYTTLGWTDCGHNTWRNGVVLDPFGGSGTVGAVAVGHGRDALLIDLDARNAWLARERVGMFLTIETPEAAA